MKDTMHKTEHVDFIYTKYKQLAFIFNETSFRIDIRKEYFKRQSFSVFSQFQRTAYRNLTKLLKNTNDKYTDNR